MINYETLEGIEMEELSALAASDFLSQEFIFLVYDIKDICERERVKELSLLVAKQKGIERSLRKLFNRNDDEDDKAHEKFDDPACKRTNFSFQPFQLDCGEWNAADSGIYGFDGHGRKVYASRIPIMPVGLIENVSTNTEKVKLLYYKNGKKELICDRSIVAANYKIVALADKGLEVTSENSKLLVRYLSDCVAMNLDILPTYKSASQLGWNRYGFAPYSEEVIFDGEKENGALFKSVTECGNYDGWKKFTKDLRKNLYVRMIMDASFASVLIEKINALPFVFHLWGTSGSGKTVALMVAMSIWGNPSIGKLVRTMNMTQNSMMSTAAFLNSIPFAGDELQTVKSRWENYDTLIMRVCEGIDRGRMAFDKNIEPKTWNCSFLFTGEEPCTKLESGGGVKNRVIDCEIIGKLFDEPNAVVNYVTNNYGFAGREFVEYVSGIDNLTERFNALQEEILENKDTTDKQAASMALILLADELANQCIYHCEDNLNYTSVLQFLADSKEVDVAERAYEFIINHVAQNATKFDNESFTETWGSITDTEIIINASVLKRELNSNGFDFDAVKKKWKEKGYLILSSDGRYAHATKVNKIKARYVKLRPLPADIANVEADEDVIF